MDEADRREAESRRLAELELEREALRRSLGLPDEASVDEAKGRALLRALPDMIFQLDREGRHVSFDTIAPEELFAPPAGITGRTVAELLPEEAARRYMEHIPRALDGDEVELFEYALDYPARGRREFEARMVRSGADEVLVIVRDVTEKKQLERALFQAEKLEAVGRLAAGVAHDFNNHLGVVMGYAELLEERPNDPQARAWAEGIVQAAQSSERLTRQLLSFARKVPRERAPVDVRATVEQVAALLERTLDRRIVVELDLAPQPLFVLGDGAQLQSALLNVALNARDAMPRGGHLHFTVREVRHAGRRMVELRVTDTGVGMRPEELAHAFEPFFTTKEVGRGTGLGLSLVYGVATSHGGTAELTSELGKGTTCTLRLPLHQGKAARDDKATEAVDGPPLDVAVVDEDPRVCEVARELLQHLGHRVTTFASGADLVARLRAAPGSVDVVVLDASLEAADGADLLPALREVAPDVGVLLCSGYGPRAAVADLLEPGRTVFLAKPYRLASLRSSLASLAGPSRARAAAR